MSSSQGICRMCHRETGKLVSPCACEGSMKFVHSRCLADWVAHQGSLRCEVCGVTYSIAKFLKYGDADFLQKNYFSLLSLCIGRFARLNSIFFLKLAIRLVTFILVPLVLALFQCTVQPFSSSAFPWYYFAPSIDVDADFTLASMMASGIRLTLIVAPLFFFAEIWCEWLMSNEILFPDENLPETLVMNATENLNAMDSEEETDDGEQDQKLLPVLLPDEGRAVLEAIASTQRRSNHTMSIQQRKALFSIFFTGIRLVIFYVSMVIILDILPVIEHYLLQHLWNFIVGNVYTTTAMERLLLQTCASEGVAVRRLDMIRLLVDAIASSTMMSMLYLHLRIMFSFSIVFFIAKKKYIWERCKRVFCSFVYLRGMLNSFMLICYVLPAVTLLMTYLCLDFFESKVLFDSEDRYQMAWSVLTDSNVKNGMQSQTGAEASPSVAVLRALHILSESKEKDTCWNFGESIDDMPWMVVDDADDALLFPIFTLTKLFSKLDGSTLAASCYLGVLIGVFVYYQILMLSSKLPQEWVVRSSLCRVLNCGFFQLIALLDGKTLFSLLFEILALTCFVSVFVVRYSLALVGYLDSAVVPIVLSVNSNRWLRVMYFVNPIPIEGVTPQEAIRALHERLTRKMGDIFDIRSTQRAGEIELLPHVVSKAIRWVAFTLCYWVCTFALMSAYMFPALYMITKRFALVRILVFISMNACVYIRVAFPQIFPITEAKLRFLMVYTLSCISYWKCQWWIRSFLALSVKRKPGVGEGDARLFSVQPLNGMPREIQYSIFCALRSVCKQLDERLQNQDEGNIQSLQRIRNILWAHLCCRPTSDDLLEEDVFLLAELVEYPTILQFAKFLTTCFVLWGLLPFIAGSAFFAFIRNTVFSTSYCYTGPQFPLFILMWVCGVLLTAFSLFFKCMDADASVYMKIIYYCGCHHLSARSSLKIVMAPVFVRVGCFTFVPFAFSIVANLLVLTWTMSFLGFFLLSMGVFFLLFAKRDQTIKMSPVVFMSRIPWTFSPHEGQAPRVNIATRDETQPVYTEAREGGHVNIRTSTPINKTGSNTEDLHSEGHVLQMTTDSVVQWFKAKLVMLKVAVFALEESIRKMLINIAERENVSGIVFVDRVSSTTTL